MRRAGGRVGKETEGKSRIADRGEKFVPDFKKREVQNLYRKDELLPAWVKTLKARHSSHVSGYNTGINEGRNDWLKKQSELLRRKRTSRRHIQYFLSHIFSVLQTRKKLS